MSALCFVLMLLIFISIPTLIYTLCHILKCPPPPLPKAAAEAAVARRMELATVVDVARLEEANGDCSVCLSGFDVGEELWRLKLCGHLFHAPCIEPWLRSRSSCPVCRAYLFFSNPQPSPVVVPVAARDRDLWQGLPESSGLV